MVNEDSVARGDGSDPLRIVKDTIDQLEITKRSLSQSPPEIRTDSFKEVVGADAFNRRLITIPEAVAIFELSVPLS